VYVWERGGICVEHSNDALSPLEHSGSSLLKRLAVAGWLLSLLA
jgi:hypothetical protein